MKNDLGALVPSWVSVCHIPEGSRPCGRGCGMVSWIRDNRDQGAHTLGLTKVDLGERGSDPSSLAFPGAQAAGGPCSIAKRDCDNSNYGALAPVEVIEKMLGEHGSSPACGLLERIVAR
jgi:hypothetical protein